MGVPKLELWNEGKKRFYIHTKARKRMIKRIFPDFLSS